MAVYCTKDKWNSQYIKKQCQNKHRNAFDDINWSTNANHSIPFQNYCNEYHKNMYTKYDKNEDERYMDEYDDYTPKYWRCTQCTFDNIERDLYCSICKSPFKSINTDTIKYASDATTFGDHLPSDFDDILNIEDDMDESIQIAIIYSFQDLDRTCAQKNKIYRKPYTKYTKRKRQKTKEERDRQRIKNERRERTKARKRLRKEKKRREKEKKNEEEKIITMCTRKCPKISTMIGDNIIEYIRKNIKKHYYDNKTYDIKFILNYNVFERFLSSNDDDEWEFVYHGTDHQNNVGIIRNGLVVGGTKGVRIRHGSCYGRGVYCSPYTATAKGYERGSMFVCIVRHNKVQRNGAIWVVPNDVDILPLYLVSFANTHIPKQSGFPYFPISAALQSIISPTDIDSTSINMNNDGLSQQLIRFIPSFKSINNRNALNRKIKRKWSAYHKINRYI